MNSWKSSCNKNNSRAHTCITVVCVCVCVWLSQSDVVSLAKISRSSIDISQLCVVQFLCDNNRLLDLQSPPTHRSLLGAIFHLPASLSPAVHITHSNGVLSDREQKKATLDKSGSASTSPIHPPRLVPYGRGNQKRAREGER